MIIRNFICSRCGSHIGCPMRGGTPTCARCASSDLTTASSDFMDSKATAEKEAILRELAWMEPDLSEKTILAVIDRAAPNAQSLGSIARQVAKDIDLLYGSWRATPLMSGFIWLLRRAGARNIQMPRCYDCEQVTPLTYSFEDKRLCERCYRRFFRLDVCAGCGRDEIARTTEWGEPLCKDCDSDEWDWPPPSRLEKEGSAPRTREARS